MICVYNVATPVITYESPMETQINEGESLELKVSIRGVPTPKVSWTPPRGLHVSDVTIDKKEKLSCLTVDDIKANGSGTYEVVAENGAGTATAEFNVVVMGSFNSIVRIATYTSS